MVSKLLYIALESLANCQMALGKALGRLWKGFGKALGRLWKGFKIKLQRRVALYVSRNFDALLALEQYKET